MTHESSNALAIIEEKNVARYFEPQGLDPVIEKIRAEVTSIVSDISTKTGREEIRSRAAKLARTKIALDELGKKLTEDQKRQIKAVDAERARAWDALEALQKEVRAPLTAWENKEKDRVAAHEAALAAIPESPAYGQHETAEELAERLTSLEQYPARDWEEFAERASLALFKELSRTRDLLASARKREAEQAELARLRQEEAERKQREHEERLKAEAAAKARAEAEAVAMAEAVKIERARVEAEERAEKAEAARIAAETKALADLKAAEQRAEAAAKAERDRIEAERKAEADATAAREADKAHRAKVNNEALNAVIASAGVTPEIARAVISAIAKGLIPHVKIRY